MGCGAGEKQGPAVCWLPAAQRAGAEFIEGFACQKVLFDDNEVVKDLEGESHERRTVGVVGTWTARDGDGFVHSPATERLQRVVKIEAKRVVVSAGSLNSPLLLMRSGLEVMQRFPPYGETGIQEKIRLLTCCVDRTLTSARTSTYILVGFSLLLSLRKLRAGKVSFASLNFNRT